jgi:hypothetical protein
MSSVGLDSARSTPGNSVSRFRVGHPKPPNLSRNPLRHSSSIRHSSSLPPRVAMVGSDGEFGSAAQIDASHVAASVTMASCVAAVVAMVEGAHPALVPSYK